MGSYLFFLLILACPLAMIFMMRGMGGHKGGHGDAANSHAQDHTASNGNSHGYGDTTSSLKELRHQRGDLDRQIEEREAEENATPVGGGRR